MTSLGSNFQGENCLSDITSLTLICLGIYSPKSMISDAFGYTFDPCSYSDHDLVSVKFNCKRTFDRGPGLWKGPVKDDRAFSLLHQELPQILVLCFP